jgi:hypothetical protein
MLLVLGLPILFLSVFASADDTAAQPRPPQRYNRSNIDDRVRQLTKALDLNEAQQSAVKKILEERRQQTLRIRHDPSMTGSARIEQFRALQDSTVERIRAVLNEEQKKKYDPFAARKIQQTPERSVEDWLKATTPH